MEQIRVGDTGDESLVAQHQSYETQILRVKDLPPSKKDVWHRAWDDRIPEASGNGGGEGQKRSSTEHTKRCRAHGIAMNQGHHGLEVAGKLVGEIGVSDASEKNVGI